MDRTIRQYSVPRQYFTQFGADQVDVSSRLYNMRRIQVIKEGELISDPTRNPPNPNGQGPSSVISITVLYLSVLLGKAALLI